MGLRSLLLHGVEEVDRAVDVAVVGHGGGGLADFAEVFGELVYVAGAVEEGVVGVEMKMGELCCARPGAVRVRYDPANPDAVAVLAEDNENNLPFRVFSG
jgi:hypothetical protein